jgi:dTDP-4-amino-4,6-dideoxygalactose transaminase/D-alanine-D-alanine ligase-like ATP-grasp enzyme
VIPLVDLLAAHAQISSEVERGFTRIINSGIFIGGEEVDRFEQEYATANGVKHCVSIANGTDAVEIALRAVGIQQGDDVILPVNTFVATAEAVCRAGARPKLVDIDPSTYLIDPAAVEAAVTPAVRAVVPVHLYGQLVPVEQIRSILIHTNVAIVEDAAQCQGASRYSYAAGSGGIAATSFYPGKNLGAYGDAGAVVTNDAELAQKVRMLGNHGGLRKYEHKVVGFNSRLDALQAVVLRAKLRLLTEWNDARATAAAHYDALLCDLDVIRPTTLDGNIHAWHLYVIRVPGNGSPDRRDEVLRKLQHAGIGAGIHYPTPIHMTPAFANLGYKPGHFPNAERAANEILSLPIHPHITPAQQELVARILADSVKIRPASSDSGSRPHRLDSKHATLASVHSHRPDGYERLHPYGQVIVDEATRRGINVEVVDPSWGELRLTYGNLSIGTRESLSELTSALALNRCQDKRAARRVLADAGIQVPRGQCAADNESDLAFLTEVRTAVVKPARGAEGAGVTVSVSSPDELVRAIAVARRYCPDVLIEKMCFGDELRALMIDHQVVAAAIRRPASVTGDGLHTIAELIELESRRRAAATDGKARIPIDSDTHEVIGKYGHSLDDVLLKDEALAVRRIANIHTDIRTGGTIRDVTNNLHPTIVRTCVAASRALSMPVTGLDLIVESPLRPDCVIFDANERPGLANYAPQPVVERFIDLLFPATANPRR